MSNITPIRKPEKVCRFGLNAIQAAAQIEILRGDDSCIQHASHLYDQMALRDITIRQVMKALRSGRLEQGPYIEKDDCWRMRYRDFVAGDDISVVVQLEVSKMGEYLVVITVIHHEEVKS